MFIFNLIDFLLTYVFGFPTLVVFTIVWVVDKGWKDEYGFFESYYAGWVWMTPIFLFISVVGWLVIGLVSFLLL